MCSDSFFYYYYSLLPLLFLSSLIRVLFSLFSFLLYLFIFFHIFSIFSHLFSYYFLIIIQLKNAIYILIQLIQCTCVHQATEVNATNQTVHYKYNFKMQSSIINCHTTNTVYVVHQTTKINRTDITSAFITIIQLIQLRHSSHSYHRVPSLQSSSKLQINLQTTVWGWVVGPNYEV